MHRKILCCIAVNTLVLATAVHLKSKKKKQACAQNNHNSLSTRKIDKKSDNYTCDYCESDYEEPEHTWDDWMYWF